MHQKKEFCNTIKDDSTSTSFKGPYSQELARTMDRPDMVQDNGKSDEQIRHVHCFTWSSQAPVATLLRTRSKRLGTMDSCVILV